MLPCADKHCNHKMSLIKESENFLYYACTTKFDEHTFRYNIATERWEKVITRSKLLFGYNENPCKNKKIDPFDNLIKSEKIANQGQSRTRKSSLLEINGIGSKSAKKLEKAGVTTVTDLAKRSPKHLSEKTGVSLGTVCKWIIEANKITEQSEANSTEPQVIECKI